MKNLNKITKYFITLFWFGLGFSILKADPSCGDGVCNGDESYVTCLDDCNIVITEIFILTLDNTPPYIEFYNNSNSSVSLENWTIKIRTEIGEDSHLFNPLASIEELPSNNFVINPHDYFVISSKLCLESLECNNGFFHNDLTSDIIARFMHIPWDGTITLIDNHQIAIDSVAYNIDEDALEESRGHSLRLHVKPNSDDNDDPNNWSLSPNTENSLWLYEENTEIKNFGSPREENSFRLIGDEDFTHIISGDVNNLFDADNNYGNPIDFSWYGTFDIVSDQKYKLIIEKTNTKKPEKHGFEIESYADATLIWESIIGTDTSITPGSLLIEELEVADYSWTVELTKGSDTIYSDRHHFSVDASDYGIYGCVDQRSCKIGSSGYPTCPTTAADDTLFSNHPIECVPDVDCYSAINFDVDANINSNTCHYVSLSVPAFVVGDANTIATVPIYFKNDSSANINSVAYTLSFDGDSPGILSYNSTTFSGAVISEGAENIVDVQNGNISVNIPISEGSSFAGAGIITYLDFELVGEEGSYTDLSLTAATVKGGTPENDISVPVKEGEIAILQTDYVIAGQVKYFSSFAPGDEPVDIPNVELSLSQKYNGEIVPDTLISITTADSSFRFEGLQAGNYNLSFSKSPELDCDDNGVSGSDLFPIKNHLKGIEPLDADKSIAADVSLDGTVSGYDMSLIAQYSVDLIDNFNDIETHWIFKPTIGDQPQYQLIVHSELLEHNGTYTIDYKPLVLDDDARKISAYRLGDVNASYCHLLSTSNRRQVQFTDIAIDYTPIITLPIIISIPTFIEGMDIEIGYDEDIFNPLSITFNNSNKVVKNYQTVSNLTSKDRTIKTVTWAVEEPKIVEGKIGEVSFNWNNKNKSGKIWLKEFQINDEPAVGGISVIGLSDNDVVDGVNIINNLVPAELSLHQNYPNPFNPQTTIKWSMPLSGMVSLEVYNLQGQFVELLFNGQLEAGIHEQIWDATAYPSGIYFYRMTTNKKILQKVMLLLK